MNVIAMKKMSWARLVSDLLSPPLVLVYSAILVAAHEVQTNPLAPLLAVLFVVFSVLVPFLILAWWVYRGSVSDIHMSQRDQRYWPLGVSLAGSLVGWLLVRAIGGPGGIHLLSAFMVILNLVAFVVTFYWQISVHSGIMAAGITIMGVVYGVGTALLLSPLLLLVGAARLKLKRHTLSQVIAGALVGVSAVVGLALLGA